MVDASRAPYRVPEHGPGTHLQTPRATRTFGQKSLLFFRKCSRLCQETRRFRRPLAGRVSAKPIYQQHILVVCCTSQRSNNKNSRCVTEIYTRRPCRSLQKALSEPYAAAVYRSSMRVVDTRHQRSAVWLHTEGCSRLFYFLGYNFVNRHRNSHLTSPPPQQLPACAVWWSAIV